MPVKSGPTSGPLTVSSHVSHVPHGVGPPLQFCSVPLRETYDLMTWPSPSTSTVVVPPGAFGSYAVAALPKAVVLPAGFGGVVVAAGRATSWLRTRVEMPAAGPAKAAIPSCRPGIRMLPTVRVADFPRSSNDR